MDKWKNPLSLPQYVGDKDRTTYNQMAFGMDNMSFQTKIRIDGDTTTMVRTRGGIPLVISETATKDADAPVILPELVEKDYSLRTYFGKSRTGQFLIDLKSITLIDDTVVEFHQPLSTFAEDEWYKWKTIRTADGIFKIRIPIAKKATYNPGVNSKPLYFSNVESFYSTDKLVLSECNKYLTKGFAFVYRQPVFKINVTLDSVKYLLVLKEPTSTVHSIYAY